MFTIQVCTNSGRKKEFNIIEEAYAYFHLLSFVRALDVKEVVMINGLTGEVLYLWNNNKWEVFNSVVL